MKLIKFGDLMVDPEKVIGCGLDDDFSITFVGGREYGGELDPDRDEEIEKDIRGLLATDLFVEVGGEGECVNRAAVVAVGEVSHGKFDILLVSGKSYEVAGYDDDKLAEIRQQLINGE